MSKQFDKRRIRRFGLAVGTIGLIGLLAGGTIAAEPSTPTTTRSRVQDAWSKVYQQLPDLPLENQYINRETGKVDPNNTLVSRMVRYHQYIKGRPLVYRLDWKLTLGDYLGINEPMLESSYPGFDNLRKNPLESDRAAISRLTRRQRNALVQALVNVFNPSASQPITPSVAKPVAKPQPTPTPAASPQTGGARLLLP
ncbi:hypothetical protein ACKFKG_21260 [Phormidesmis sp. 146-35]